MDRLTTLEKFALRETASPSRALAERPSLADEKRDLPAANTLATASGVDVAYTRTTTVQVDPARLREQRIFVSKEHDPIEHAYKVVRTHVLQRMRANGWRTLAITSAGEGNGKTLTAINLGISLAREVNQTVLLVDLDLRRPSLGRYFVPEGHPGLSDYLMGEAELSEILIHPNIERLVILPGHKPFIHSSEILSSPRMVQLVREIRSRYEDRMTLFDMPPLLASDDVIAFLPYLDAVLLVVEEGKTTKEEIQHAQQLLGVEKIIGMVLNKSASSGSTPSYY
ncbi:exopolysaccharide biosynthesis protein [Thiocystis minor]|uniref:CpsD/CapB family tyrosine-protein kinase n=1 Tax=Thiocystis minor TaxID=61597 RepID=UPI0019134B99|nr:CpsD/CapB family tyrosine-protein kinase [Thiocystis minor]MBK5966091.1 exopolysaccharide biosynthesis protein [Thiocystis minor]